MGLDDPRPWEMKTSLDYRFNNGRGAVLYRKCRIIIDSHLSYDEALERWNGKDLCVECKRSKPTVQGEKK